MFLHKSIGCYVINTQVVLDSCAPVPQAITQASCYSHCRLQIARLFNALKNAEICDFECDCA